MRSGITGMLRLGTVPTASTTASLVLSAFCSAHPLAKVHILSRLAGTELYRRLREFELDAAIVHAAPDEAHDVNLVPLYEEHYVLLSPADMLGSAASTMTWPEAAQLPLALLTADMRDRQIIDKAFADHAIERDSAGRNRLRRVAIRSGRRGELGMHRAAHLVVDVAVGPGSPRGGNGRSGAQSRHRPGHQFRRARLAGRPRARAPPPQQLSLNEFFDTQLSRITHRR